MTLKFWNFLGTIKFLFSKINWIRVIVYAFSICLRMSYYIRYVITVIVFIVAAIFYLFFFIIFTPHRHIIRFIDYRDHKLPIVLSLIFLGFMYFNFYNFNFTDINTGTIMFVVIYLYIASIPASLLLYFIYEYEFILVTITALSLSLAYKIVYHFNFCLKYSISYPITPKEFFTLLVYTIMFYIAFKIFERWYYRRMLMLGWKHCLHIIKLLTPCLIVLLICIQILTFKSRFTLVFLIFLTWYCYVLIRCCVKAYAVKSKYWDVPLLFNGLKFFIIIYVLLKIIGFYPINCQFEPILNIPLDVITTLRLESLHYTLYSIPDSLKLDLINKSSQELSNIMVIVNKFVTRKELEYLCNLHTFLNSNYLDVNDLWTNLRWLTRIKFELYRLYRFRNDVESILFY